MNGDNQEKTDLQKDVSKILEALRPLTPGPVEGRLPTGVSEEQWKDMKNLTDLLDILKGPKPETPPVSPIKP